MSSGEAARASLRLVPSVARVVMFRLSRNSLDRLRKKRDQTARKLRSPKLITKSQKVIRFFTKLIDNKVVYADIYLLLFTLLTTFYLTNCI